MPMFNTTIKQAFSVSGTGIHSGVPCTLTFEPAPAGHGIVFYRTDLNNIAIPLSVGTLRHTSRATLLGISDTACIRTPEHLLATCSGLGLTDLKILCSSEEIPIFDGSAAPFCQAFLSNGLHHYASHRSPFVITKPVCVSEGDAMVMVLPGNSQFTYYLSYSHDGIQDQVVTFSPDTDSFVRDIASARTFGFRHEIDFLLSQGLAKGATLENAIVVEPDGRYSSTLRFPDELARHKCLDLMGDCWVLNRPIQGHVVGIKSGHSLTAKLIQKLVTDPAYVAQVPQVT